MSQTIKVNIDMQDIECNTEEFQMTGEVTVSFVLAIYNVSEYLRKCIDSIICEDGDYEVLLIDDGSTDESGGICDEYEKRYTKVKSFHKNNGGLSDARNYGLYYAKGKYIIFIDSDDYLPIGASTKILEIASENNTDICIWKSRVVDEKDNVIEYINGLFSFPAFQEAQIYTPKEFIMTQIHHSNTFATPVWTGMYKREFLLMNNLWFEKGIIHEDELWTPKVYLKANRIFYVNDELYCYKIRSNSLTCRMDNDYSENLKSCIYIYSELPVYYDYFISDSDLCRMMKANISRKYLQVIARFEAYKYPQIAKNIPKWQILKNTNTIKDFIKALVLILNVRLFCVTIQKVKKYKLSSKKGCMSKGKMEIYNER